MTEVIDNYIAREPREVEKGILPMNAETEIRNGHSKKASHSIICPYCRNARCLAMIFICLCYNH